MDRGFLGCLIKLVARVLQLQDGANSRTSWNDDRVLKEAKDGECPLIFDVLGMEYPMNSHTGWQSSSHQTEESSRLSAETFEARSISDSQRRASKALLAVSCIMIALGFLPVAATGQQVVFDTSATVACRDITTAEFSASHPHDRLMEAAFEVSSLQRAGRQVGVECLVQVYSPNRSIQVVDYEPKTQSAAEVDGLIAVEKTREGSASMGVDGGGTFNHLAQVSGHATAGTKTIETESYQKLAPREIVLASGVMHRGAGVYYKVRSTPQQSIEGGRQFVVRFRVHDGWRGGLLKVACLARGKSKRAKNPLDTRDNLGANQFVVAAYLQGDAQAQRTAESYARWEFELRRTATALRDRIEDESYPKTLDRIGRTFGVAEPRIPKQWLTELIHGDPQQLRSFEAYLPNEMRRVTHAWLAAREELKGLDSLASTSRY